MAEITAQDLRAMFSAIAATIAENRDRLSELDGVIGDADHGITMELGFSTVKTALAAAPNGGSRSRRSPSSATRPSCRRRSRRSWPASG